MSGEHWLAYDENAWVELFVGETEIAPVYTVTQSRPQLVYSGEKYAASWRSGTEQYFSEVDVPRGQAFSSLPEAAPLPPSYTLPVGPCAGNFYSVSQLMGEEAQLVRLRLSDGGAGVPVGAPLDAVGVRVLCDDYRLVLIGDDGQTYAFLSFEGESLGMQHVSADTRLDQEQMAEGLLLALQAHQLFVLGPSTQASFSWREDEPNSWSDEVRMRLQGERLVLLWNDESGALMLTEGRLRQTSP
jgi:hypothetical protein